VPRSADLHFARVPAWAGRVLVVVVPVVAAGAVVGPRTAAGLTGGDGGAL
jgi:hypothetical protein